MAVTFHNATVTAGPASVGAVTLVHTISGADACLLVYTHANTAISISAMAANGLALTRLGQVSASSSRAEVWGLTAAPIGNLGISANVVGAASLGFCMVAVSYRGQVQFAQSPFGTVVAGTAQGVASVAFSVSSTTTDLVSFGFGISANTTIALNTGTSRGNTTHSVAGRLVVGEITGAAAFSISATAPAIGTWSFLGVPIVASAVQVTTLAFDNAAYSTTNTVRNSMGLLLTATSNAVLLVWAAVGGGDSTLSTIAIGSTQLTRLGVQDWPTPGSRTLELWGLTAPPSGILTISAVIADGVAAGIGLAAVTYTGAKFSGGGPFGGVVTGTASNTATTSLIISSTVGNFAVFGFSFDFSPGVATAGPGLTQRVLSTAGEWPDFLIADVGGLPLVSGSAAASGGSLTNWGGIGINLIQQGYRSANAASIVDVADKLSATGYVVVSGRMSATDAPSKLSATGYVVVSGRLSATGAADLFSASGYVIVSGRLSATGAADRFSASGYTIISGRMSATDVIGTLSASGYVIVSGRLSATDIADRFSASGYVTAASTNSTGFLSATEAADTFSASGYTSISGRMSATDVVDKLSASGYTIVSSRLSATDVTDRFSAAGYVIVSGRISATDVTDLFLASGTVSSAAIVVTTPTTGTGGGGHKEKKTEYFRADDAFWDAREKYLLSLQPAISAEPEPALIIHPELPNTVPSPVDPALLIQYRATRAKLVTSIPDATNMRQLRARGKRLYEVNARIAEQKRLQAIADERQCIAAREARQLQRAKTVRRVKRRVALLAVARAAVALTYLIDKL